jgi:hypothetical protein
MYVCDVYMYVCMCVYVCVYVYMYACMHMYIYMSQRSAHIRLYPNNVTSLIFVTATPCAFPEKGAQYFYEVQTSGYY